MPILRNRPIKQKLVFITMVSTAAALLLAGAGTVVADSLLFRQYLRRDLPALASIIADNSVGALDFNDPDAAAKTLGALRARPHLVGACVFRTDGSILAQYARGNAFRCPAPQSSPSLDFRADDVAVFRPVVLDDRRIGDLFLLYDLGEIAERIRLYGVIVFGVLVAASALAFFLSSQLRRMITTPISRLVRATTSVVETGDYQIRVEKSSGDELGILVDRFNEMLMGIHSRDDQLKSALSNQEAALKQAEEQRRRFQFMAESMPVKIFTARPDGYVDYFNRQWMEFTGSPFDEIKGWEWARFIHPEDLDANLREWRASLETGQPFLFQHRFRRADGAYRWHLSRAHAMRNENGCIAMWIGSNTDIHEQKETEEELRRANADLQQFAYSASHDLQEPIRNVAVYSEIVSSRYQKLLDADGQLFLGFLREGGRRLATLINDLLAYTRAGMVELSEKPIPSSEMLKDSLADLSEAIRENGARITYESLPEVFMGAAHLELVFQNLIGNALKYRDEDPPRIHISAADCGAAWRFSIKDNGIGIESQYKEQIFGVFKRLHHDQRYSGTGIGLAICQRVVQRYGGRIWVESEPGKGSTFFFTIPKRVPPNQAVQAESSAG